LWEGVPLKFDPSRFPAKAKVVPRKAPSAQSGADPEKTNLKGFWNRLFAR
jgi:hypothetical protein